MYRNEEGKFVMHDGYFLAADTGSLIKGTHIDVFLGRTLENPFEFVKSKSEEPFQAFIIQDERRKAELLWLHQ